MEIQLWSEILHPYEQAVAELVLKFRCLRAEYRKHGLYSPIESVSGRVKSISSILEKMQRKGVPMDQMEEKIEDIAGLRIICQFVEDIEKVARDIEAREDLQILVRKDYLGKQKKSGYRSYHIIALYKVQTIDGSKNVKVEIQIRTMGMNFWATTEHHLQYKYKGEIPEHISVKLQEASDALMSLDREMSEVRSEIIDAMNDYRTQTRIVKEILGSIENLYRVASEREVKKIQDEFYEVFRQDNLEDLKRFQKQLDIIAEGYRAQSLEHPILEPQGSRP